MAVYEKNVLLTRKDAAGNTHLLYPITTLENVDGSESLLNFGEAQELTEAQKAQARKNIGAAAVGEGGTIGSLKFEDDGAGNVTIVTTGGTLKFTDDGNGNITMGVA
jgi:hypothetical protein